jgi:hypothetical protein
MPHEQCEEVLHLSDIDFESLEDEETNKES